MMHYPAVMFLVDGTNGGAMAGIDGSYIIFRLMPGDYSVSVSIIGYETNTKTCRVEAGKTTTLNFELVADRARR